MSQSKILTRLLAARSGSLTSMFIARPPLWQLEPIIGRERIVDQDLAAQTSGNSRRQRVVAVELPVGKIRGVEQYIIRTHVVDHPFDQFGRVRRVERLDGEADVVAHDLGRR